MDVTGGSVGLYGSGNFSLGFGGILTAGPQVSGFSDLSSFQGWGVGGEVDTPWFGVMATTPLTTPGSGAVITVAGPGDSAFAGVPITYTKTYEVFNWRKAWASLAARAGSLTRSVCPSKM